MSSSVVSFSGRANGFRVSVWRIGVQAVPYRELPERSEGPYCSSLLAEEFRLLPEIRLLQGDEQQTIHKQ
ncbi:hypothetical protein OUZ56_005384 [Daphnia magna]|uniref:Uncharacterized protein n=1 Tax=Daphnia magna TaxID=35525 RepID=A0ABQ9YSN5_9CRUS|nr:hypothetical protein OUZ56_005384 [Daphnia magna]